MREKTFWTWFWALAGAALALWFCFCDDAMGQYAYTGRTCPICGRPQVAYTGAPSGVTYSAPSYFSAAPYYGVPRAYYLAPQGYYYAPPAPLYRTGPLGVLRWRVR